MADVWVTEVSVVMVLIIKVLLTTEALITLELETFHNAGS